MNYTICAKYPMTYVFILLFPRYCVKTTRKRYVTSEIVYCSYIRVKSCQYCHSVIST